MTNLAVFEHRSGDIYIEISAPNLPFSQRLFVAAADTAGLPKLNPSETVQIPFASRELTVFFLLIASIPAHEVATSFRKTGTLAETDSINIINHIVDILAYP